jgi:hypothetical protein
LPHKAAAALPHPFSAPIGLLLAFCSAKREFREAKMGQFIPDYLIREQAAVGALVLFAVLRVLAAVAAFSRGWPIALVEKCAIGVAGLYCAPQLFDVLAHPYVVHASSAELEGKVIGSAMALFFSPILSHRLGYE